MTDNNTQQLNPKTGQWEPAIPCPYYYSFFPWIWKRLTGYRDAYGRKAYLLKPWEL